MKETKRDWKPWAIGTAVVTATALAIGFAVTADGQDVAEIPPVSSSIWVLNRDGGQYARINTAIAELGTPQRVENPNNIAQYGEDVLLFGSQYARFAAISTANPPDLSAEAAVSAYEETPAGTRTARTSGDFIAYVSDDGAVYRGNVSTGGRGNPVVFDSEEDSQFKAAAIALDSDGDIMAYSPGTGEIRQVAGANGEASVLASDITVDDPSGLQLAYSGSDWVLLDSVAGALRTESCMANLPGATDGRMRLQISASPEGSAYVADSAGLAVVDTRDCSITDRVDVPGSSVPASPVALGDTMYAGWIADTGDSGTLWSAANGTVPLDFSYEGLSPEDSPLPIFMSNGSDMLLNDTKTGLVWDLTGALIPSSAVWDADLVNETTTDNDEEQRVTEPKPPVAEPDSFGVRAGSDAVVPVLLNDHDPNKDVLSIVPESIQGLPPEFGTLSLVSNDQMLVVTVSHEATGTATLTYQVTDGTTAPDSEPATVTLEVKPPEENSAPVWCGDGIVAGCLSEWPEIVVEPGGSADTNVLSGWVDPEGDPIFVSSATQAQPDGVVVADPDGTVTYHHSGDGAGTNSSVSVVVSDAHGAASEPKALAVQVSDESALAFKGFAYTGVIGQLYEIDVTDEVTGALGSPTIVSAALDNDDRATVAVSARNAFTFSATEAGTYPVQVNVRDESGAEVIGTVKVTVTDPAQASIATIPVTAFVRENEDATVEIMPTIKNPSGIALLLDDLQVDVASGVSLTANVVGSEFIRFTGTRLDGGEDIPTTLGTGSYRVTDGTDAVSVTGRITFVMLPGGDSTPPIARDDVVTMRVGDQIDVPVLDNDVAPAGATIQIDASKVAVNQPDWEEGGGLAFGTDRQIRLLAPQAPGEYSINYTIFRLGHPTATSTATLRVIVNEMGSNAAPAPAPIEGRVVSGGSVTIPIESFGGDPDGDSIVLDKILSQPQRGSASISADGSEIVYTANPGVDNAGQDQFTYQVRDFVGERGTGTVRMGIQPNVDVAPVTYTDYVQVQVNNGQESESTSAAVVFPLRNDIDPQGLTLSMTDVVPNVVRTIDGGAENAEFGRLASLVSMDKQSGQVTIQAGDQLGTFSYQYRVENEHGDSATGLIIVKVVNDPVPDYPVVTDTRLTSESLDELPRGVDVLSGKVSWNTGDISGLTLDLPFDTPGFSVDGWRIRGNAPKQTTIVPFRVTGAPFLARADGSEVQSYGFLRIPGESDVVLALRAGTRLTVDEGASESIDLRDVVLFPADEVLEVGTIRSGGSRAEGSCTVSGTTVTYAAGQGAPWEDSCTVEVRVSSFDDGEYAQLTIPVTVVAEDPEPVLRSGAQTVSPGQTQSFDLTGLVTWERHTASDISSLRIVAAGDTSRSFEVVPSGSSLSIKGLDSGVPGTQVMMSVSLPDYPSVPAATLSLTVGPAPAELPRGATVSATCGQADAGSCTIDVIGKAGEFNPLPSTPLTLVDVSSPANCPGITFSRASDRAVSVSWSADAAGHKSCTGSFTVKDAQGRTSSGDRLGQVMLDFRAYPAAPISLEWTGYSGSSVTVRASAPDAYPAVDGFELTVDGSSRGGACDASGMCTVSGLDNGAKHIIEVKSRNAEGTSRTGRTVEAWAYQAPQAPSGGSATPVLDGQSASLQITGVDSTTSSLTIAVLNASGGVISQVTAAPSGGSASVSLSGLDTSQMYTALVTPTTRFDVPPIPGGSHEGSVLTVPNIYTVGAPILSAPSVTTDVEARRITATASASANYPAGAAGIGTLIGFSLNGAACTPTGSDGVVTFDGLSRNVQYTVTACAVHTYGGQNTGASTSTSEIVTLWVPNVPDGGYTYSFGPNATSSNGNNTFTWNTGPTLNNAPSMPGYQIWYSADGGALTTNFGSLFSGGARPGSILAYACEPGGAICSQYGTPISPTGPAWAPQVRFPASMKNMEISYTDTDDRSVMASNRAEQIRQNVGIDAPGSGNVAITYSLNATFDQITFSATFPNWSGFTQATWTSSITWKYIAPEPTPEPTPDPTDIP